jgi:excinuclease ABC subunit C
MFRKGTAKRPGKILYIGKAASLRDRVRSYFASDLANTRGPHIRKMVEEATALTHERTNSVLEALILEANLIKRHLPPYNAASKDNTSFNHLVVTKENFPRVLVVRGRELYQGWKDSQIKNLFGPFPQGYALREALKIVRKIFPYRDGKCVPCPEQLAKRKGKGACKGCFNRQIGLCPGVCTGEMRKEEYAKTVKNICELFSGNFKGLKRSLAAQMKAAAEGQRYEEAARYRRQIDALAHIKDVSLIKGERVSAGGGARIEAFDVAHTGGTETVAVMTVVSGAETVKAAYRKFKIQKATNNDVAALTEACLCGRRRRGTDARRRESAQKGRSNGTGCRRGEERVSPTEGNYRGQARHRGVPKRYLARKCRGAPLCPFLPQEAP